MSTRNRVAVYPPPKPDLPYVVALIEQNDVLRVVSADSVGEAKKIARRLTLIG